jgi:hypothetical protein
MKDFEGPFSKSDWICAKCGERLTRNQAKVQYLGSTFSMDLLKCPLCDMVMVTEEKALGVMAEAEKVLEDK